MALAFDAVTYGLVVTASSQTFSHTNNGDLVAVGLYHFKSGNNTDLVSGITYAGVSTSRVNAVVENANERVYLHALANAASGANNVVITYSTTVIAETHAISYSGAATSGQPDAQSTNSATSTNPTGNVTTVADNSWMIMFVRDQNNITSMGSGTTNRSITDSGGGAHNPNNGFCDSGSAVTPAGSKTLTVNANSEAWATCSMSISPFVAAAAAPFQQQVILT